MGKLQALLPEALVPLTLLQPRGRALLCGDPKYGCSSLTLFCDKCCSMLQRECYM